ncbi:MAG: hypothetical protein ACRDH9_09600 [Actinomycetota bacterium]
MLVLQYEHGIDLDLDPTWGESASEWLDGMDAYLADIGWGATVDVRNTTGVGREFNEVPDLPALVHWVEHAVFLTAVGTEGESLQELIDFAETIPYCVVQDLETCYV